jgi:hypothetical protein
MDNTKIIENKKTLYKATMIVEVDNFRDSDMYGFIYNTYDHDNVDSLLIMKRIIKKKILQLKKGIYKSTGIGYVDFNNEYAKIAFDFDYDLGSIGDDNNTPLVWSIENGAERFVSFDNFLLVLDDLINNCD